MSNLVFAAAVMLVACKQSPARVEKPSVMLKPGESAEFADGWNVSLNGVTDDSRCPVNVQCVWQGDALVRITVWSSGGVVTPGNFPLELHTGVEPRSAVKGGYRFTLDSLTPAPRAGTSISQADYRAWISVRYLAD